MARKNLAARTLYECIYCSERKCKSEFNREHALQQAFGRFEQNFVLHRTVCTECNDYFGRHFDILLSRETPEGLQRYQVGFTQPDAKTRVGSRRLRCTVEGSEWRGAILEWRRGDDGRLAAIPLPQVGIRIGEEGPYTWYPISTIPSRDALQEIGFRGDLTFCFFSCEPQTARAVLEKRGFLDGELTRGTALAGPTLPISIAFAVDAEVARAVAKIAVNYMAYHYPRQVRAPEYLAIRRFVRYGEGEWRRFVTATGEAVIKNIPTHAQVMAHAIAVSWNPSEEQVIGQVSLFNWLQYRIVLGAGFILPQNTISLGHMFEPNNGVILPLTKAPQPLVDLSYHQHVEPY